MAENQPVPTPAVEPDASKAPAQQPVPQPAEQKPAEPTSTNSFDSLSDEDKSYLKSQGIEDLSKPESITKLINHNASLRKNSSTQQAELDKLKRVQEALAPATPTDGVTPQPGSQSQSKTGLDPVTAFNISSSLANSYPSIKEDLESGKFYSDFQNSGRTLVTDARGGR